MRKAKLYSQVPKRIYRAEITTCMICATRLRRYATVSRRTLITLDGPVYVIHCSYRCPNPNCAGQQRVYRSAAADALALPGFTFGLDIVVWVGQMRLGEHQTLDQTHQAVLARLAPFGLSISRRETLYLFDAYCTLVRAAQAWQIDTAWQTQVAAQGGLILSLDGIQPDKGNETIYLVRGVLTGRLLVAENVRQSSAEVIQALLLPIKSAGLPVAGVVSDAQISLVEAVATLWPDVPHQICQFHYLREASRPMYEQDRSLRVQVRKAIQQPIRQVRDQIARQTAKLATAESSAATSSEAAQLAVLDDYALGIQTALNLEGQQPFRYASLEVDESLAEVAASLETLEKKGPLPADKVPSNWRA